nr:hypothetical protein 19 [bacterium]
MKKKYVSKNDVVRCISIVKIADEFGIQLEDAASGNFNKRCTCPSKEHKNGNERTGSLYIDTLGNNFYCFGCNTGSNVIDFYMLCADLEFVSALKELKKRVDPSKATGTSRIPVQYNLGELLKISDLLRRTMLSHPNDLRWISRLMKNIDRYIFNIASDDVEGAKALHDKVKREIAERYQ